MLRKLLLRDALLHGRMMLISYGLFAAFQAYFILRVDSARAWLVFASIYAAFLSVTLFAREDKFQANAWTCTLPVSRREIVKARFVAAWLLVAAALAVGTILAALIPGSKVSVSAVLQPDTLLIAAAVVSFVVALVLPFLIRFGLLGLMIFLVAGQVLGVGMLVFAMLVRTRGGGGLRRVLSAVAGAIQSAHAALPPVLFELVVVVVLLAVNWAGYRLAAHLFARRDL